MTVRDESVPPQRRFDDQSVVVAGAGGALGAAITERFLREGARVVGCDWSEEALDAVRGRVGAGLRRRCSLVRCDVSDAAAVERLMEHVLGEQGRVDVLVNNAGVSGVVPVVEMSEAEWDRVLAVNAKSVFLLSRAVLPGMLASESGAIVNIASQAGKRGEAFTAHYCAAKAAVINFARALALEVAPHVRVNTVCPGYVDSAMTRTGAAAVAQRTVTTPERLRQARLDAIPLRRQQTPDDIAATVCFLASNDARNITGVALDVNGGETMN